ncbi:putative transcription activator [Actinobacillus equuli]|nr:putative transcription activator [Actinobacillus equuli]
MADGSLPKSCFQHYLKQDYLYLYQYCRALSLGIYKAENFEQMRYALEATQAILNEVELHLQFCREWGIEEEEVRKTPESSACVAYTRYVLDCGMRGGLAELFTAIAPCAIGYAEIGKKLADIAAKIRRIRHGLIPMRLPNTKRQWQNWRIILISYVKTYRQNILQITRDLYHCNTYGNFILANGT